MPSPLKLLTLALLALAACSDSTAPQRPTCTRGPLGVKVVCR